MRRKLPDGAIDYLPKQMARVKIDANGCWLLGCEDEKNKYFKIKILGMTLEAHRFFYECIVGPIQDGLVLDHLCRVPGCVNPEHLEPVSIGENVLRGNTITGINSRKTHCLRGHELSGDNLVMEGKLRKCRACKKLRDQNRTPEAIEKHRELGRLSQKRLYWKRKAELE